VKFTKRFKWMAAAVAMTALFASAPVAYGGVRWTGIDPEVNVNGHPFNVSVFWPEGYTCSIQGDIQIKLRVPEGASAEVKGESSGTFDCNGSPKTIQTDTDIFEGGERKFVTFGALVESPERFPVRLLVEENNRKVLECKGQSNRVLKCHPLRLKG
jgi:hypothetical protein